MVIYVIVFSASWPIRSECLTLYQPTRPFLDSSAFVLAHVHLFGLAIFSPTMHFDHTVQFKKTPLHRIHIYNTNHHPGQIEWKACMFYRLTNAQQKYRMSRFNVFYGFNFVSGNFITVRSLVCFFSSFLIRSVLCHPMHSPVAIRFASWLALCRAAPYVSPWYTWGDKRTWGKLNYLFFAAYKQIFRSFEHVLKMENIFWIWWRWWCVCACVCVCMHVFFITRSFGKKLTLFYEITLGVRHGKHKYVLIPMK